MVLLRCRFWTGLAMLFMRRRVEPGCTDVPQLELLAATKTNRCNFFVPRESQGTHSQLHDGLDRSFRWKTPIGCECALVTIASTNEIGNSQSVDVENKGK